MKSVAARPGHAEHEKTHRNDRQHDRTMVSGAFGQPAVQIIRGVGQGVVDLIRDAVHGVASGASSHPWETTRRGRFHNVHNTAPRVGVR